MTAETTPPHGGADVELVLFIKKGTRGALILTDYLRSASNTGLAVGLGPLACKLLLVGRHPFDPSVVRAMFRWEGEDAIYAEVDPTPPPSNLDVWALIATKEKAR